MPGRGERGKTALAALVFCPSPRVGVRCDSRRHGPTDASRQLELSLTYALVLPPLSPFLPPSAITRTGGNSTLTTFLLTLFILLLAIYIQRSFGDDLLKAAGALRQ